MCDQNYPIGTPEMLEELRAIRELLEGRSATLTPDGLVVMLKDALERNVGDLRSVLKQHAAGH